AAFAYIAMDDYKDKQRILISQAAAAIAVQFQPYLEVRLAETKPGTASLFDEKDRPEIVERIRRILENYRLETAKVYLVDPLKKVLVEGQYSGSFNFNNMQNTPYVVGRYSKAVDNSKDGTTVE